MADLAQIERALRAADAAGNTEDARRLAQAYAAERSKQRPDFSNVQTRADTVSAAPQPSLGQRVGREIGLGARAMLQGGLGTVGIFTDPIARAAGLPSAREGASALADTLHLPTPQTASERVGGGVTEAVSGGGGLIGLGRSLATRAPGIGQAAGEFLSSQPASQLASLVSGSGASGVTRESGGSERAQGLAGLAGGLAAPFGVAGAQATTRGLLRGGAAGRERMAQGISDFRAVGAQPSVGQAVGNRRTQGLESLLAGSPTASGRMASFAERQAEDIGAGLQRKADSFFPNASGERAGRAIERGVKSLVDDVQATRSALYDAADNLIAPTMRLPLTETRAALARLTTAIPGASSSSASLVNPRIASLAKNVEADLIASKAKLQGGVLSYGAQAGLPFAAVRSLRTQIGRELSDFSLVADRPTAQYKELYGAMTRDLEQAAAQQGPEALQAMRRANNYYKASVDRLEQVQRVVDKNGGPEKVYAAVMSGTQDGGTTLRAVMQSLPKDGQRAVTAAVIKRMGLPTPGQAGLGEAEFSAQTFLTNWKRVSPEARRALFDRHGPAFSANMDKIARVAERIRTGSKVFANPSGTANRAVAIGYYGGLAGTTGAAAVGAGVMPLAGLVIGGLSANTASRVMTNPRFVEWLARATEMPVSALPQQIVVLKGIAKQDPDVADVLAELEGNQPVQQ